MGGLARFPEVIVPILSFLQKHTPGSARRPSIPSPGARPPNIARARSTFCPAATQARILSRASPLISVSRKSSPSRARPSQGDISVPS